MFDIRLSYGLDVRRNVARILSCVAQTPCGIHPAHYTTRTLEHSVDLCGPGAASVV
jgi:hypothetical protein